jgi:5-hydroxyisourate hydrolase
VLNTASGKPAAGVAVVLQYQAGKNWEELGRGLTDLQGRAADLYQAKKPLQMGTYRLVYETGVYFKGQGTKTFFPQVEIIFEVEKTDEHYHVPLLLSPFGYSTYRGS